MLRAAHDLGRARRPGRAGRGGGPRADVGLRAGRPRATALPAGPADLAGALRRAGGGHRRARRVRLRGRGPPVDAGHEGRTAGMRWARERGAVIGIEFTTFSLIGRCERTGMPGIAIATSEMAVGSRCIHVAPGVGAVVTQASTNPRLGHLGLNLLRAGYSAPHVLEELAANDQFVERRQLGCLDVSGLAAARTGSGNKAWAGHRVDQNVVVAANAVVSAEVADAMFRAFQQSADLELWERLLRSLEAGKAAGGQPNGEVSGGLFVVDREPFAMVDLRVDLHPEPLAELRRLADAYFPLVPYYNLRPRDPNVPSAAEWLATQRRRGGG